MPGTGVQQRQFVSAARRDSACDAGRALERRVVHQYGHIVQRRHRIELDRAEPVLMAHAQCGQGVLGRKRSSAAMREHARPGPGAEMTHTRSPRLRRT